MGTRFSERLDGCVGCNLALFICIFELVSPFKFCNLYENVVYMNIFSVIFVFYHLSHCLVEAAPHYGLSQDIDTKEIFYNHLQLYCEITLFNHRLITSRWFNMQTRQESQADALQLTEKTMPCIHADPPFSHRQLKQSKRARCHAVTICISIIFKWLCWADADTSFQKHKQNQRLDSEFAQALKCEHFYLFRSFCLQQLHKTKFKLRSVFHQGQPLKNNKNFLKFREFFPHSMTTWKATTVHVQYSMWPLWSHRVHE